MKNILARTSAAIALASAIIGSSFSTAQASDLSTALGSGTLRVGAVAAAPWYQRDLLNNQWKGLVPDVINALLKGTDVKVEYVETQWGTAVAGLQSDRFDLLGGFNNTPERAKAVDFTRPMGTHKIGVLTLEKDAAKYATWEGLERSGARLAAIDGSAAANLLQPKLPHVRWVIVPGTDALQLEIESGRADAMVTNDVHMALYIASRGRGTMVIPTPVQEQPTNMGLRKNRPELRAWLDQRLAALQADGTLERIWAPYVVEAARP